MLSLVIGDGKDIANVDSDEPLTIFIDGANEFESLQKSLKSIEDKLKW